MRPFDRRRPVVGKPLDGASIALEGNVAVVPKENDTVAVVENPRAYGGVSQPKGGPVHFNKAKDCVSTVHKSLINGSIPAVNGKSTDSGKIPNVVRQGAMNLADILARIDAEIARTNTTAAEVSRKAGREDIVRVFQRAVKEGRNTNVATLEAIAAGLGVSEQWLLFGSDQVPSVELEARIQELSATIVGMKAAMASFLSSIGLEGAEAFVDSLEEIARTTARSHNDSSDFHDLRQQARGLSVQAARQLRTKPS